MVNVFLVGLLLSWVRIVEIKLEEFVLGPKGGHDEQVVCISWISVAYFHVLTICSELNLVHLGSLEHVDDRKSIVDAAKRDIGPVHAEGLLGGKPALRVYRIFLNDVLCL